MLHGKPGLHLNLMKCFIAILLSSLVFSCTVLKVKNYPDKPFVYNTKINLTGDLEKYQKTELLSRLRSQLDDSIRVRTVTKFLFFETLNKPAAYDSLNAETSILYMRALLSSLGYFYDSISYRARIDTEATKPPQYRTFIEFDVNPGPVTKLDSLAWNLNHQELKRLTDSAINETFLKKGNPFATPTISAEMDRLVELYRNSGYSRFSREELIGVWDTLDAALLRPTLDPFEQLQQLEELRRRRLNPTADLEIRLKPEFDSAKLKKYYVGGTTIYTDYRADSSAYNRNIVLIDSSYRVVQFQDYYKPKLLAENIFFKRGDVYSQRNNLRTINRFNSLGAWRLVTFEPVFRPNTDTVDYVMRLTPADKYSFDAGLEGSFNTGDFYSANLLGIGVNFGVINRNAGRASNQTNTNFRLGTELDVSTGQNLVQTLQLSLGHTITIPRFLPRFSFIPQKLRDNYKTIIAFNVANTDRLLLFNFRTFNTSYGWEASIKNKLISIRLPNVEYSDLIPTDSLNTLIKNNPSMKYIFTDGLVISVVGSFTRTGFDKVNPSSIRFGTELAAPFGLFRSAFFDSNLYRFLKFDGDYRKSFRLERNELAFRFYAGLGYSIYDESRNPNLNKALPFFKQFFGGGPNSMRGWSLRTIGPGSVVKSFDQDPVRYGDIQVEFNTEFRFPIANIAGVKINSALYGDFGNIWMLRDIEGYGKAGQFQFKKMFKEFGAAVGTGLRVDFSLFLIRLDYAWKARDPSPPPDRIASQNKWFYDWGWKTLLDGQIQIGINYPF